MRKLEKAGVHLYTNNRKKINVVSIEHISVSYGIDWFELNGTATAGNIEIRFK